MTLISSHHCELSLFLNPLFKFSTFQEERDLCCCGSEPVELQERSDDNSLSLSVCPSVCSTRAGCTSTLSVLSPLPLPVSHSHHLSSSASQHYLQFSVLSLPPHPATVVRQLRRRRRRPPLRPRPLALRLSLLSLCCLQNPRDHRHCRAPNAKIHTSSVRPLLGAGRGGHGDGRGRPLPRSS